MNVPTIKNVVLTLLATVAFLVVIGDESPNSTMPFAVFFLIKLGALAVFAGCLQAWGVLNIKDIFTSEEESHV